MPKFKGKGGGGPFKMKGSPHKLGEIEGTSGYNEALERELMREDMPMDDSALMYKKTPLKKEPEFPGLLPEVEVPMSEHKTTRDVLAEKAYSGSSTPTTAVQQTDYTWALS